MNILPVPLKIKLRTVTLVYKTLHGEAPVYLTELLRQNTDRQQEYTKKNWILETENKQIQRIVQLRRSTGMEQSSDQLPPTNFLYKF